MTAHVQVSRFCDFRSNFADAATLRQVMEQQQMLQKMQGQLEK